MSCFDRPHGGDAKATLLSHTLVQAADASACVPELPGCSAAVGKGDSLGEGCGGNWARLGLCQEQVGVDCDGSGSTNILCPAP